MKWIEAKMQELGVFSNTNYKLAFMMDSLAMITVHTPKYGIVEVGTKRTMFVKARVLTADISQDESQSYKIIIYEILLTNSA